MPENNKVMYDGQVVMDISDSTLSTDNMLQGVVGYSGAGVRTVGTLNPVKWEQQNILGSKNLNSYPYADAFPGNQLSVYYDDLGDGRVMANGINNYNTSPSWCMLHSCVDGLDMISGSNSYLWVNNLILPNGTYTLNGCPQGGSASTYYLEVGSLQSGTIVEYGKDTGNGFTFTLNGDDYSQDEVRLHLRIVVCDHVQVTNLIFAPMIRLSSITDDTFEPYARTNYDETQKSALWSELNLLGAKNLLSPDYNGSITGDTSVTFTVNSDGSVTINGTTNALTSFCLKGSNDGFKLPAGHFYALSGGHDGVNVSVTVTSKIRGHALSISKVSTDNKDALFTVGDNLYNLELYIKIPSGTVCNNITIKPMIRLGSISDNTWQPYTYTNREITDKFLTETMGHNIKNPSGTTMTKRDNLKFSDSHISDDSTNNQTIVDIVKEVTTAQWNNATEEGLYYINDKPDSIITAEQVAYGNGNVKTALDSLNDSGNISITGTNISDFEAQHFYKDGIAYINGYITTTDAIPANSKLGELNVSCDSNTSQWIGYDIESSAIIRGYIYNNEIYKVGGSVIPTGHTLQIMATFKIASS